MQLDVMCVAVLCSPASYLFHLELRNLLIVLCSTQLYTPHTTAYPGAVSAAWPCSVITF